MLLKNIQLNYVHHQAPDQYGKYSVQLVLAPKHPQLQEIDNALNAALAKGVEKGKIDAKNQQSALRDYKDKITQPDGSLVIQTSSVTPVPAYNAAGDQVRSVYGGSTGHAKVNFFAYKFGKRQGLSAGLDSLLVLQNLAPQYGQFDDYADVDEVKDPSLLRPDDELKF